MKKIIMTAAFIVAAQTAMAASTNLNYTVAEINTALGNALALTNATRAVDFGDENEQVVSNVTYSGWTDLDLSAYLGTNSALAMLFVSDTSGASNDVRFRQNGETKEVEAGDGITAKTLAADASTYFWVPTDSSGVVEVQTSGGIQVELYNYIRKTGVQP